MKEPQSCPGNQLSRPKGPWCTELKASKPGGALASWTLWESPREAQGAHVESKAVDNWLCKLPSEFCSKLLLYKLR